MCMLNISHKPHEGSFPIPDSICLSIRILNYVLHFSKSLTGVGGHMMLAFSLTLAKIRPLALISGDTFKPIQSDSPSFTG